MSEEKVAEEVAYHQSAMIFNKEQQHSSGALKDVPLSQSVESRGMEIPLTNDVSWKNKSWRRKSTRIGALGIVVICILLSAIVALAVLLYESRNNHSIRAASISEEVHDVPIAELMSWSSDMQSEYSTAENKEIPTSMSSKTKEIPTSVSSKNKEVPTSVSSIHKEIEEAIMEKRVSSRREDIPTTSTKEHEETSPANPNTEVTSTTSSKEHEETSTANPNTLEHKDTSAEITMKPDNQESISSPEHEETTTENPQRTFSQEFLTEKIPLTKDLVAKMNVSSNDTVVVAEITIVNVEYDLFNDTDYDELSEIDFGGTSEVLFGDELEELGYGKTSEMEYENYDNEFEGLFDDSDDSMLLQQNDLEMVPKIEWGGVPPIYMTLRPKPSPYVVISQTNSRPCFDQDSCSLIMRLLQTFALEEEDLPDMCDNFYIGGDGKVYVGRGPNVTNCHIGFVRLKNIAISFIGDFEEYGPTAAQVKALEKLISVGVSQQFLAPDYKIIAHNEIKLPESLFMGPGKYLLDEINSMPHRCNYTCIGDSVSSDDDDDSSGSNIMFMRFFG